MSEPQLRYNITVPMGLHERIVRAAAAAKISEGRYVSALFAGFCQQQIGQAVITSETDTVDRSGLLTGAVTAHKKGYIAPEKPQIEQPPAVREFNLGAAIEILKKGQITNAIYRHICAISQGEEVGLMQKDIAECVGCSAAPVAIGVKALVAAGLISYKRGGEFTGYRSRFTAPLGDMVQIGEVDVSHPDERSVGLANDVSAAPAALERSNNESFTP